MGVRNKAAGGLLLLLLLTGNALWMWLKLKPSWFAPIKSPGTEEAKEKGPLLLVYHVGSGVPYGRMGNQLTAIFHCLDMALDKFIPNNPKEVANLIPFIASKQKERKLDVAPFIVVSGWARDVLQSLFFEPSEPGWPLRLEEKTETQIVDLELFASNDSLEVVDVLGRDAFYYTSRHLERVVVPERKRRRLTLWKTLLENVSASNREAQMAIVHQIRTMSGDDGRPLLNDKYLALHMRSLEGSCYRRIGDFVPVDECGMSPSYIKRILNATNLLGRIPVVVISDMQTPEAIAALENDEEIGNMVIVARNGTMQSDMIIAVHSDIFVGVRVSTMSKVIGQMRVAGGHEPQTNYIYVDKDLDVCGECIFFCNKTIYKICGENVSV